MPTIETLRRKYHQAICQQVIHIKADNKPSMADVSSHLSVEIARGLLKRLRHPVSSEVIDGQTAGQRLEQITKDFLEKAFGLLQHLRPGHWQFSVHGDISDFDQYRHLGMAEKLLFQFACARVRRDSIVPVRPGAARFQVDLHLLVSGDL